MTTTLAVGIDPETGSPTIVLLEPDRPPRPIAVSAEPGTTGRSPMAVAAATAITQEGLDRGDLRVTAVVDDDLDLVGRNAVVRELQEATGATEVIAVPTAAATAHRSDAEVAAMGAGAALAIGAAHSATTRPPITTRDDLEGPTTQGVPPVVVPPAGSSSVFDDPPPSAGTTPPPITTPPSTTAGEATPPMGTPTVGIVPPPAPPGPPPGDDFIPDGRVPPWVRYGIAAVLLAILGVGLAVWMSGDDGAEVATDDTTTTSTVPTSTTEPAEQSSTTTTEPSTTTTSTTSTTTSTTTTTTTTVPPSLGDPGAVTLVETGLQLDSGTILQFGQRGDVVVDEIEQVLGSPDDDTGWVGREGCATSEARIYRWGELEVVFTWDDGSDDGTFGQWVAYGADDPTGLVTVDGLGVGSTVGFLEVNYGSTLEIATAIEGDPTALFAVTNEVSGGTLVGLTSGLDPTDTVTDLWAGDACQRVFL